MGLRPTPGQPAPTAQKGAAQHAPEGVVGADLNDFESAFGGMFTEEDKVTPAANRFKGSDIEEDEELDEEQKLTQPVVEAKPTEKDPLEGLEETQRSAREKWKLQKELKELRETVAELKKSTTGNKDTGGNPLKGKSREEIVDIAMAAMEEDGDTPEEAEKKIQTMSTEEIIKKAKEEMRKEMQEENAKSEESKKAEQAISTFKGKINTFVTEKAEQYPTIAALGGTDAVYKMIEDDYLKNEEEFGLEYAQQNMMKIEQAAKKVNETLASEVRKALKSPYMRKFVLELAKEGGLQNDNSNNQTQDFSQLEDEGAHTLTNSVHRRVTDPKDIRDLTEEEALEQSFAYLGN